MNPANFRNSRNSDIGGHEKTAAHASPPEQRACHLAWRRAPGVFAFHPANGGWRSRTEAAILKELGVVAGVPGIILMREGRTYALGPLAAGLAMPSGRPKTRCARPGPKSRRLLGWMMRSRALRAGACCGAAPPGPPRPFDRPFLTTTAEAQPALRNRNDGPREQRLRAFGHLTSPLGCVNRVAAQAAQIPQRFDRNALLATKFGVVPKMPQRALDLIRRQQSLRRKIIPEFLGGRARATLLPSRLIAAGSGARVRARRCRQTEHFADGILQQRSWWQRHGGVTISSIEANT
jgi:hypothetical protein